MSKLRVDELESLETGRTVKVDVLAQTFEYAAGVKITSYNQMIRDSSGGFWRVNGTTALPYTLTGAGDDEGGKLDSVGKAFKRLDTLNDLRTIVNIEPIVYVTGYYTRNDAAFGDNVYVWDAGSNRADNGGTVIKPTSVSDGRYILQYSGGLDVAWFGAKGDGVTDDTDAINTALAEKEPTVLGVLKTYLVTATLNAYNTVDGRGSLLKTQTAYLHSFFTGTENSSFSNLTIDGEDQFVQYGILIELEEQNTTAMVTDCVIKNFRSPTEAFGLLFFAPSNGVKVNLPKAIAKRVSVLNIGAESNGVEGDTHGSARGISAFISSENAVSNVLFSNCRVENVYNWGVDPSEDADGYQVQESNTELGLRTGKFTIENCVAIGCTKRSFKLMANNTRLVNCTSNSSGGLTGASMLGNNISIESCTFKGASYVTIFAEHGDNSIIDTKIIRDVPDSIGVYVVSTSDRLRISNVVITTPATYTAQDFAAILVVNSSPIYITDSVIDCGGQTLGITINSPSASRVTLSQSFIVGSTTGIRAFGATGELVANSSTIKSTETCIASRDTYGLFSFDLLGCVLEGSSAIVTSSDDNKNDSGLFCSNSYLLSSNVAAIIHEGVLTNNTLRYVGSDSVHSALLSRSQNYTFTCNTVLNYSKLLHAMPSHVSSAVVVNNVSRNVTPLGEYDGLALIANNLNLTP